MPAYYHNNKQALDHLVSLAGRQLRLATPLGIGKPNALLNALYQRVKADHSLSLDIYTAITLKKPAANSELEAALLNPIVARWYGDYPDLDYACDLAANKLPANMRVFEFFFKSGDWLGHADQQQNFIASHYTNIARDMVARRPNVVMQAIACAEIDGQIRYSLSANPDLSLDVIEQLRARGEPVVVIGAINRKLPFMAGDAFVDADLFDVIVDDPANTHDLFVVPWPKVSRADYAIGLAAASLVRDGGTLQIGIGSLGDAISHCLLMRQQHNATFRRLIDQLGDTDPARELEPFTEGLYSATEMLVAGLLKLYQAGLIKRPASELDAARIHAGFFMGPASFYQELRELNPIEREQIQMMRVSFTNELYGDKRASETEKRQARRKGSFINTCMMVTLTGHVVSDGLTGGQVVSGIGGQHNFVSQANALDDAHSMLLLRSFRMSKGKATSNIVPEYGNTSVTRHFRDIVITEYGAADLRGKTDSEVILELIQIADSRFQAELLNWAKQHGKVAADVQLAEQYLNNTPESLAARLSGTRELLPDFPFDCDFTDDELRLMAVLGRMQTTKKPLPLLKAIYRGLAAKPCSDSERLLQRIQLDKPQTLKQRLLQKLFLGSL